jgi:hypothetical protein
MFPIERTLLRCNIAQLWRILSRTASVTAKARDKSGDTAPMQHFYILNESSDKTVAGDVNLFAPWNS